MNVDLNENKNDNGNKTDKLYFLIRILSTILIFAFFVIILRFSFVTIARNSTDLFNENWTGEACQNNYAIKSYYTKEIIENADRWYSILIIRTIELFAIVIIFQIINYVVAIKNRKVYYKLLIFELLALIIIILIPIIVGIVSNMVQ